MPRNIRFTIYNVATGDIRCTGSARPDAAQRMVRPGEALIENRQGDPVSQRVVMSAGRASIRMRAAADIEARRAPRNTPPPTLADLLEALAEKGVRLTQADLDAARARRAAASASPGQ